MNQGWVTHTIDTTVYKSDKVGSVRMSQSPQLTNCYSKFAPYTDWISLLDGDEVLVANLDGTHINAVPRLLDILEERGVDGECLIQNRERTQAVSA